MRKITLILLKSLGLFVILPAWALASCGHVSTSTSPEDITKRIQPVGSLEVEGGQQPAATTAKVALPANAGELRYKSTCSVCHETGVGGAPKFKDAADWKPRMAAGIDGMLKIAIQGKGAMPPKGTCMQCSDEELRKAIEYMLPK